METHHVFASPPFARNQGDTTTARPRCITETGPSIDRGGVRRSAVVHRANRTQIGGRVGAKLPHGKHDAP